MTPEPEAATFVNARAAHAAILTPHIATTLGQQPSCLPAAVPAAARLWPAQQSTAAAHHQREARCLGCLQAFGRRRMQGMRQAVLPSISASLSLAGEAGAACIQDRYDSRACLTSQLQSGSPATLPACTHPGWWRAAAAGRAALPLRGRPLPPSPAAQAGASLQGDGHNVHPVKRLVGPLQERAAH